jgi:hypothetical protein
LTNKEQIEHLEGQKFNKDLMGRSFYFGEGDGG